MSNYKSIGKWYALQTFVDIYMIITIRGHDEEYPLEFKLWKKKIDFIPSIPLKQDDLHSAN